MTLTQSKKALFCDQAWPADWPPTLAHSHEAVAVNVDVQNRLHRKEEKSLSTQCVQQAKHSTK